MTWLYRKADAHRCSLPQLDPKVQAGDLWQCDHCGMVYVVHTVKTYPSKEAAHSMCNLVWFKATPDDIMAVRPDRIGALQARRMMLGEDQS